MGDIFKETESFREYQTQLGREGRANAATSTLTTKIRVLVPAGGDPEVRWGLILFSLDVIRSPVADESVKIGAAFTIISIYSERPGALIRSLLDDPDIEIIIIDVGAIKEGIPVVERRGDKAADIMAGLSNIRRRAQEAAHGKSPFVNDRAYRLRINDTSRLMTAIMTIEAQVWVLIAKAVTAPDTAEESERRRWEKYMQQKRVNPFFELTQQWLTEMRNLISYSLSVRKFMVEILIEAKKTGAAKGRVIEMISDIGNYVEEAGMAGFFVTIRFGLETRYPALALNEFQADLNTIKGLMRLYKEIGPRAPFMVLLEESIQTKFSPGAYPILWSFAMGVATTLDKSMGGLNINRSFLEAVYFKLGQQVARHHAGSIDTRMAETLGLSKEQIHDLSNVVRDNLTVKSETIVKTRDAKFAVTESILEGSSSDDSDDDTYTEIIPERRATTLDSRDQEILRKPNIEKKPKMDQNAERKSVLAENLKMAKERARAKKDRGIERQSRDDTTQREENVNDKSEDLKFISSVN